MAEKASSALDTVKEALSSALPGSTEAHDKPDIRKGPQELIDRTNAAAALSRKPKAANAKVERDVIIGKVGVVHPIVLQKFEIDFPCSALEFDIEVFL